MTHWTEENIADLRQMVEVEKLSAGEAAAALGVTRNAVIGRAARSKIELTRRPGKPLHGSARTKPAPGLRAVNIQRRAQKADPPLVIRETLIDAEPLRVDIVALAHDGCRFPYGDPLGDDFAYCGLRTDTLPYCAQHRKLTHTPEKRG